jgi:hypothetical protein
LESGPKQFWFKTAADEDIISNSFKLESLLISETLISNDSSLKPLLIYGPAVVHDESLLIGRII